MNSNKSNSDKTILVITVGFLIISKITESDTFLHIALAIGVAGAISSTLSKFIELAWMKIGSILGLIVPNILLSVVFYVFLYPVSIASKLFRKTNPLSLKNTSSTLWVVKNNDFSKESLEKPW